MKLTISLRGIHMQDLGTGETRLEVKFKKTFHIGNVGNERFFKLNFQVSIYRISYCSADATYDRVFAFISTNRNETLECHAFLCPKRKMVRNAAHLFKAFWREKGRRTLSRICLIFQRHVYCTVPY